MWPSVRAGFIPLTSSLEGVESVMYTDAVGLVTTARGKLIDPGPRRFAATDPIGSSTPAQACVLPWVWKGTSGGEPTVGQVASEFWKMKRAWPGIQSDACNRIATMCLSPADVDKLTLDQLDEMWAYGVAHWFPDAEAWPAAAQMGLLSMDWAMGDAFEQMYPAFTRAARARDWATCAAQCTMNKPPVPIKRNALNQRLFTNAATAADPSVLTV